MFASRRIVVSALSFVAGAGLAGACGDDGAEVPNGYADARSTEPAVDAASSDAAGIDAALVDAAGIDAALVDAAGIDAAGIDAAVPSSEVIINEVLLDQTGADSDEFVELKGMANTDYSALTVLQIDGDQGTNLNAGLVVSAHVGCMTDANGYCEISVNANSFQNGSQTLVLVSGSTATAGQTDVDADDDGVIDNEPWTAILDGVGIVNSETDYGYAGATVLMKTVSNGGEPVTFGGASRIPDGTDTDSATDWVSNTPNFDNTAIASGQARNTPGAVNSVEL